ncbi:general substrate transporter [Teratosphaeria nubilosa]|uniref:General substrate transporter n=1 Tax=Teratosphaeria nubilosa TaxID=161662 RepID=A0A6G1L328_9PEZI|nr:general substrate transporter [Teratosphaeria nubilosa]
MLGFTHRGLLGGRVNGKALEIGVCATASSGFFLLGYDQGVMSGIITEPIFLDTFPQMNSKNKEDAIQALVVAIYEVGCLFGALAMVAYGDKIGRRRAVLLGASIMIIGAILQTSSYGLAQLIVGRIVTGIGNGMNTRGIVVSYWLNYGFWFITSHGSLQWRFPIGFQMLFGLLLIFGVLLYPESPRWLLKHGKEEDAAEIMGWLHECSPEDPQVRSDIDEINELNAATQGQKLTWGEFFGNKDRNMNLWRASAACGSQAMQQISGINLVTYYATVFEDSLGFDGTLSRFMTAWLGTEYFLSACLALFIVDRLGRRFLMMSCAAGMAGCLLSIGACLSFANKSNKGPAYAATVFIFVYDSFFAIGWLGVTWLYPAEVTPIRTRAEAAGFATATNWIFNYLVVQLAPIMINTISWKTYFVFFCFNIAFVPIVYFFLPETNGYKLETLDAIFAQAHDKGENPVFTEKRVRKDGGKLQAIEASLQDESNNTEKPDDMKNGVEGVEDRSEGSNNGHSHPFDEEKHIDEL